MSLIKAMATVAGMTAISRVTGFVRDIFTAAILGAGPVADAFFVALKLPNFFRRVTAEGAFSVSFVPLYSKKLEVKGVEAADSFASNVFMVMLAALSLFTVLCIAAMPFILYVIAPGFHDDPLRYDLALELTRITFPYLLLMSLSSLVGGVLNAHDRFGPFAFAPVLFNLCLIASLLLSDFAETVGHAMSWGILISGFLQLFWLLACAKRSNFRLAWTRPRMTADTKKMLKLMGPGVVGAGVMQINLFVDLIIASFLASGSISYLYYADRLNQLPLGTVGIAVGTALLPLLSRALAGGRMDEARGLFNRALEYCFLLALPAAAALAVIPLPIISVLFERGEFTSADAVITASVLAGYAVGLPAYIAVKIFSTIHWARHDTATPVKIAIAGTIANIVLCLAFIPFMGVAGIALATGLTGWLQFGQHLYALKKVEAARFDTQFKINTAKILGAVAAMAVALFGLHHLVAGMLTGPELHKLIALAILVGGGGAVYGAIILLTGVVKISEVWAFVKNGMKRKTKKA
ncbi:MAG: murein biosynthesis integral membrane protein MurJ [Alphaproteobacteria bacterium]|nr:murein biosynthesis integral membrane protein MurJ [Alphaproteobacteria bacterium]MCD8571311.1 murein biosynthesis integral membrane protein MurJ [Alphaproteobacteria bacterium]